MIIIYTKYRREIHRSVGDVCTSELSLIKVSVLIREICSKSDMKPICKLLGKVQASAIALHTAALDDSLVVGISQCTEIVAILSLSGNREIIVLIYRSSGNCINPVSIIRVISNIVSGNPCRFGDHLSLRELEIIDLGTAVTVSHELLRVHHIKVSGNLRHTDLHLEVYCRTRCVTLTGSNHYDTISTLGTINSS